MPNKSFSLTVSNQIKPFKKNFHLNERVQVLKQDNEKWLVETNKGNKFKCSSIIIAGGVGSFEPRKISKRFRLDL